MTARRSAAQQLRSAQPAAVRGSRDSVFHTTPEETLMPQDGSPDETVFASAEDPDWLPPEINTGVAHSARVYNYLLGGRFLKTH